MNEREALQELYDVLRSRHYGRMPEEVQKAYDAAAAALASAPAATQAEAVSPMAKMAQALRGKALAERAAFDTRVQSGEWGPMPDAGTEADCPNAHVATIEGDDAVRQMRWNPNVAAFDYEVGTKLYAAPTPQPTAPARAAEATQPAAAPGYKLVPMIPNAEMNRVMDSEGWAWEDLLAAACAITEDEYEQIAGSGTFQPAQPATAPAGVEAAQQELIFPAEPSREAWTKLYAGLDDCEDMSDICKLIWSVAMDEASACVRKAGLE